MLGITNPGMAFICLSGYQIPRVCQASTVMRKLCFTLLDKSNTASIPAGKEIGEPEKSTDEKENPGYKLANSDIPAESGEFKQR
jgi:hypothetical protein